MNENSSPLTNRRHFLKTSSGAVLASTLATPLLFNTARAASPGDTIKVGLVGCGGRGVGAAQDALNADPNAMLTAVGDIYDKQVAGVVKELSGAEKIKDRVNVPEGNRFVGFDSYKAVIDSGVDLVILATPPGFRPQHVKAAVAAGKHLFVEKPVATDAPGVRSILESTAEAKKKNLAIIAGFCWRYNLAEKALFERILAGDIGEVRSSYVTYNTGFLWDRTNPADETELQKQMRNWYYHTWLSGDFITEQAVHALDWMSWAHGDVPPVKCIAHGGRQVRTAPRFGDIYDHFEVVYEYANGGRGFAFARQQAGCASNNLGVFYGDKGTAYEMGFAGMPHIKNMKSEETWKYAGKRPSMYLLEHQDLFASIRAAQ
jgi:predicted dehydrogenase